MTLVLAAAAVGIAALLAPAALIAWAIRSGADRVAGARTCDRFHEDETEDTVRLPRLPLENR